MNITDVNKSVKAHKARKRRGRGAASGLGKTGGSGQGGLGSRAGANFLKGFIGGQTSLMTRLPKRGFNNANFRTEYIPVNLYTLEERAEDGATIGLDELRSWGISIRRGDKIKILGKGDLSKKLTIKAHAFSKSGKEKIEQAGGTAEVVA